MSFLPKVEESASRRVAFSMELAKRLLGSVILPIGLACGAFLMSATDRPSDERAMDIGGVRINSEYSLRA